MATPTFNPPIAPSPGTRRSQELNLLEAEFGDGYSQVSPRGLNHLRRKLSVSWEALTRQQHDQIVAFFNERAGWKPFNYTPPGETEPVRWTCKEWDYGTQGGVYTITAQFRQDFNADS